MDITEERIRDLIRRLRTVIRAADVPIWDYWAEREHDGVEPEVVTHTYCHGVVLVPFPEARPDGRLMGYRLVADRSSNLRIQLRDGQAGPDDKGWSYWSAGVRKGPHLPNATGQPGKNHYSDRLSMRDALQIPEWSTEQIVTGLQRAAAVAQRRTEDRVKRLRDIRARLDAGDIDFLLANRL